MLKLSSIKDVRKAVGQPVPKSVAKALLKIHSDIGGFRNSGCLRRRFNRIMKRRSAEAAKQEVCGRIGHHVKDCRERLSATQNEFAELVGCSQSVVADIEAGRHWPRPWLLERLSSVLEMTKGELLGEKEVEL